MGSNIGHSIAPWIIGVGGNSNVVKVDGPGGYDYFNAGPESDATGPGVRHYLDIANGSNSLYQSFQARCSGQVKMTGAFSTRANLPGRATIAIRNGLGAGGPYLASNSVSLPGGTSKTDPWKIASTATPVVAGQTYSFAVSLDNNLNFDEADVTFTEKCQTDPTGTPTGTPPVTVPCCPPFTTQTLQDSLVYLGSGGIAAPYTLKFNLVPPSPHQMQAYLNYANALNPAHTLLIQQFTLFSAGTGNAPQLQSQVGVTQTVTYAAGGGGVPTSGTPNFFPPAVMQVGTWYRVASVITLGPASSTPGTTPPRPRECDRAGVYVRIQVMGARGAAGGRPVLEFRNEGGGPVVERPLGAER